MTGDFPRIRLVKVAGIIGAVLGGLGYVITQSPAVFILILTITGLMMVTVPTGSGMRHTLSLAVVAAAPLVLLNQDGRMDEFRAVVVIILGGIGVHAYLTFIGVRPRTDLLSLGRNLLSGFAFLAAFALVLAATYGKTSDNPAGALTLSISVAAFVLFASDGALWAMGERLTIGQSWGHHFAIARGNWPVAASILATGVFFGIAWTFTEWWWALPVSLLPYAFAHRAFHRAHETRRIYRQTIRALSRIPEVSALSPDGHGDRTAALSLDIAKELGMSPADMHDLAIAAQIHDIGRIVLNQPSTLRMGFTDEDIARWGSEMVAEVAYLTNVSQIVLKQHDPYRRPGEQKDPTLPMGSKIIKAASAYDHATTELGFSPVEALEVLHRGAAYDYDPDVVVAIRSVLEHTEIV